MTTDLQKTLAESAASGMVLVSSDIEILHKRLFESGSEPVVVVTLVQLLRQAKEIESDLGHVLTLIKL